jgi:hypothetical protein
MRATRADLERFGLTAENAKADLLADVFAAGHTRVTLDHALWLNGPLRPPPGVWIDADAPDCWLIRATPQAQLQIDSGLWMSDVHVEGNNMPGPNIVAVPGSTHQHLRDCNSTGSQGPALDASGMVNGNGNGAGMILEGGMYIRSLALDEAGVQYSERPAIVFSAYDVAAPGTPEGMSYGYRKLWGVEAGGGYLVDLSGCSLSYLRDVSCRGVKTDANTRLLRLSLCRIAPLASQPFWALHGSNAIIDQCAIGADMILARDCFGAQVLGGDYGGRIILAPGAAGNKIDVAPKYTVFDYSGNSTNTVLGANHVTGSAEQFAQSFGALV